MLTRSQVKKYKSSGNQKRIIFYDLETTGFNPYYSSIIEIGAIDNFGNNFSKLINYFKRLDDKIVKITGITNELLDKKGSMPKNVFRNFVNYIEKYSYHFNYNIYMVSHNNDGFDKLFLKYQFQKYNIDLPKNLIFVDTLRLAQLAMNNLKYHNMNSLCKYFNIINQNAHRALSDAKSLKIMFDPLLILFKQKYGSKDIDFILKKIYNPY